MILATQTAMQGACTPTHHHQMLTHLQQEMVMGWCSAAGAACCEGGRGWLLTAKGNGAKQQHHWPKREDPPSPSARTRCHDTKQQAVICRMQEASSPQHSPLDPRARTSCRCPCGRPSLPTSGAWQLSAAGQCPADISIAVVHRCCSRASNSWGRMLRAKPGTQSARLQLGCGRQELYMAVTSYMQE